MLFFNVQKGGTMKVWKDIDEVVKMIHELPNNKLRNLDREMTKKPKFDKSKINLENRKKKEKPLKK